MRWRSFYVHSRRSLMYLRHYRSDENRLFFRIQNGVTRGLSNCLAARNIGCLLQALLAIRVLSEPMEAVATSAHSPWSTEGPHLSTALHGVYFCVFFIHIVIALASRYHARMVLVNRPFRWLTYAGWLRGPRRIDQTLLWIAMSQNFPIGFTWGSPKYVILYFGNVAP